jgi:hypothetical protein
MRYFIVLMMAILFFVPACTNKKAESKKSLSSLHKMLNPDLTKKQLIAKWGEPDGRGSGRDLLYYDLPDGNRVTLFYINDKLVGAQHKDGTIVEFSRKQ